MSGHWNLKMVLGLCLVVAAAIAVAVASAGASTEGESVAPPATVTPFNDGTTAVDVVQPAIAENFALFRAKAATAMPSELAKALASPTKFGRNADLARAISTATGTGWVIPGDGYLCIAMPDPAEGYAESCTATDVALQQGLWVGLRGDGPNASSIDTVLVPDGYVVSGADGKTAAPSALGVVSGHGIVGDGTPILISGK